MRLRVLQATALLIILFIISGCYQTDQPMIERGQKVPIAGEFECKDTMVGGTEVTTLEERRKGLLPPDFSYFDKEGNELKFSEIDGNLNLVQVHEPSKGYGYVFIDFIAPGRFVGLVPDGLGKSPYLDQLALDNNVAVTPASGGLFNVDGKDEDVLRFLRSHDKSLLTAVTDCKVSENSRPSQERGQSKPEIANEAVASVCEHSDEIDQLANFVLKNLRFTGKFGPRRLGAVAAYLRIRYGDLSPEVEQSLLRKLEENGNVDARDLTFSYLVSRKGLSEAFDHFGEDRLETFVKLNHSALRELILADGGQTFSSLFSLAKQKSSHEIGGVNLLSFVNRTALMMLGQPASFRRRFANISERDGHLLLAGFVLATLSSLDDFHGLKKRYEADPSFPDWISAELDVFMLTLMHDTGPTFREGDDHESRLLHQNLYSVLMADFQAEELALLNFLTNLTGEAKAFAEIADALMGELESGNIDPRREPGADHLFIFEKLIERFDRTFIENNFSSFAIQTTVHFNDTPRTYIDWLLAIRAIEPSLKNGWIEPVKPKLLSDKFDWDRWAGTARSYLVDNSLPSKPFSDMSASMIAELMFQSGDYRTLVNFIEEYSAENQNTKARKPDYFGLARDFMMRLDLLCDASISVPGRGLFLGGLPTFKFSR